MSEEEEERLICSVEGLLCVRFGSSIELLEGRWIGLDWVIDRS